MKQRTRFRWKVFMVLIFHWPLVFFYSPGQAEEFPEPDPPKIDLGMPEGVSTPNGLTEGMPSAEWTFHKTADDAHPDGNEQQFIWLMNRARANPTQEGVWLATMDDPQVDSARDYFAVDLQLLQDEFAGYGVKPPAAFDVRLYNAAQEHSQYLISIDAQNHDGQFDRIDGSGFKYTSARGSVFSYSETALYGHAAFNIDWGYSSDGSGMQDGRGHRKAIMSIDGNYTNVGIAAVPESDAGTAVGPLVVTGNYCYANANYSDHYNRFLVGTVWEDGDGDSMYDPGEGIGGVTVMPDQGTYYAVTGSGGGYAIPVLSAGSYQVTLSGLGIPGGSVSTASVGTESVLLDFIVVTISDTDGDGVPDEEDAFPQDVNEWLDTDGDGIGNNADPDDDGDGMPDSWEQQYTLDPLVDDSAQDPDGDGHSNLQEYLGGSNPRDRNDPDHQGLKAVPWLLLLLEG